MNQRGVTIIEMMVSIVIGMGLVAVLLAVFSTSSGANRASDTQAQMNEDAQFALQLLAKQIRLADYRDPTPAGAAAAPLYGVFGCDNGFSNATGAAAAATTIALTCNTAATTGGHGLLVSYHADRYNSTLHAVDNLPTDCIGNSRALIGGTNYTLLENRYFVNSATRTLNCAANGGATPFTSALPLVENVEKIEFFYGVANGATKAVAGYRPSVDLGAAIAVPNPALWPRVLSVRICITMRSEIAVLDKDTAYFVPCSPESTVTGNPVAITDRHARKTYSMTVALRNRL